MSSIAGSHNPYVGPRNFTEEDSHFFFGRERQARDLLSFVISEPLIVFYAQSGAGKTSLIKARLVPGLRKEGFNILPIGRVGGALPAGVNNVSNIFVFSLLLSLDKNQVGPRELADVTLAEYLVVAKSKMTQAAEAESVCILIIDQFEEIFTTHRERWHDRKSFFLQLTRAIENDPFLWIVLTLREDHIAALESYGHLLPNKLNARFYMRRMEVDAAREAVEKPALKGGRPFAPGVAESLVDNLRQIRVQDQNSTYLGEYIEPVQLQVVCYQLWENLKQHPASEITAEDTDQLGDVDTALAHFYEKAITITSIEAGESEAKLRRWFEHRLITEAGTRGIVYQGTETTAEVDNRAVKMLVNQYLLRAEHRAGGIWYELIHDRFIEPIRKANDGWRLQQSLVYQAAELWERSGRSRDKLYQGEQLKEVLANTNRAELDLLSQEFLIASEEAQSQRELAEMEQRVAAQRRVNQRLSRLTRALVVVFLIALGAAGLALSQWNTLADEVIARETAEAIARENEQLAIANAAEAVADQQTAVAGSTEVAKAYEIINASLATQAAYLELQLSVTPLPVVTLSTTETPPVATPSPTRNLEATSTAAAIQAQLVGVQATQTAISAATPTLDTRITGLLFANFPKVPVNVRLNPSAEANIIATVTGPEQLRVLQTQNGWVQVSLLDGRLGWANGYLLTYEGNPDLLPRGLRYRVITNRDNLPFASGIVVSFDGINGVYLLRDPQDELSRAIWVPVGTEVTVLLQVNGSPSYGSGIWYLVDLVDPSGEALWTGYLPSEVVTSR